ncbi:hypothetical protein EVG20_g11528 [Dentipellis fragilis]|uniref:Uncharacterized protein n=1 Tax=Dentipellis fragilis TaxID=205917 RepID=A0A4Y9XMK2_9AGAM|nr:hypothetical protein EVG20_g11528 [Dentipellis fragilis]
MPCRWPMRHVVLRVALAMVQAVCCMPLAASHCPAPHLAAHAPSHDVAGYASHPARPLTAPRALRLPCTLSHRLVGCASCSLHPLTCSLTTSRCLSPPLATLLPSALAPLPATSHPPPAVSRMAVSCLHTPSHPCTCRLMHKCAVSSMRVPSHLRAVSPGRMPSHCAHRFTPVPTASCTNPSPHARMRCLICMHSLICACHLARPCTVSHPFTLPRMSALPSLSSLCPGTLALALRTRSCPRALSHPCACHLTHVCAIPLTCMPFSHICPSSHPCAHPLAPGLTLSCPYMTSRACTCPLIRACHLAHLRAISPVHVPSHSMCHFVPVRAASPTPFVSPAHAVSPLRTLSSTRTHISPMPHCLAPPCRPVTRAYPLRCQLPSATHLQHAC